MKKLLIGLILGIFLSNVAGMYCEAKVYYWFKSHRGSQGMKITLDFEIAEWISRPINKAAMELGINKIEQKAE